MAASDVVYRCFVGGLAWTTDDHFLEKAFSHYGEVVESKIINDRETGGSRGFGFVTFANEKSMRDAIEGMNGQNLDGRNITVIEAQSRGSGGGEEYEEDFGSLTISSLNEEGENDMLVENELEVDVEEDEDEDESDGVPMTLGFLEKSNNRHSLLRHLFPSKAGGVPAWLDPVNLPGEKARNCGFCRNPLQFVLQVYAPISGNGCAFHRTLYVFMCPSMSCLLRDQHEQWKRRANGSSPRSVKVFRCQLPRVNTFYSSEPPKHDGTDKPSGAEAPLCCWCGTWKGDKVCNSCKTASYCSEKHQAAHWQSGHRSDCRQIIISSQTSNCAKLKVKTKYSVFSNTLWPEFEILNEDECLDNDEGIPEGNGLATSLMTKQHKDDETFNVLSEKFEGDDDKRSWASFQERIARAPEQVLRYSQDEKARPLWPVSAGRPSKQEIPKCTYCSSLLCFEFQILPQLLYYFAVKDDAESLDWATIAVYTCSASCKGSLSYMEEFPWVQIHSSYSLHS